MYKCIECDAAFYTEAGMSNHKQKTQHGDEIEKAWSTTSIPSSPPPMKKRKRHTFISEEEFDRESVRQKRHPIEWKQLPQGNIYKLEHCSPSNERVIGTLTDRYNGELSVFLPTFLLKRIISRKERNIKLFVRRGDGEEADVVTCKKSTCKNCKRDFSSENYLKRHVKYCKSM